MRTTPSYFEYQERKKLSEDSKYVSLPQDIVPFTHEELIEVKHSRIHPREFAKLFPHLAKPRKLK